MIVNIESALLVAEISYVAVLICILVAEFSPWRRPAVWASLASIFLASMGSTAWCLAALKSPDDWGGAQAANQQAAVAQARKTHHAKAAGAAREEDEVDDDDGEGSASGSGYGAGGDSSLAAAVSDYAVRAAIATGLRKEQRTIAVGDTVVDCADCPELVIVPGGSASIGASDDDPDASPAEKPARQVRIWPGFAMAREAVSAASFARFLSETGRTAAACERVPSAASDRASCVTAEEAGAYAAWLSARTGKAFRLPAAIEWEYAARIMPRNQPHSATLKIGAVAEIVADCWQGYLPGDGHAVLAAASSGFGTCDSRIVKGAALGEPAKWQRLSARRPLANGAASSLIGFRLMRGLSG